MGTNILSETLFFANMVKTSNEILDDFLQSLSQDELDFFRRFVRRAARHVRRHVVRRVHRHVRRASHHVRRHVRRAVRHVRRVSRHVAHHAARAVRSVGRFVTNSANIWRVVRALRSLGSRALDIAGLNFHHDVRDILEVIRSRSVSTVERILVRLIVRNMCGRVLERNPTVGPAFIAMRANRRLARTVNSFFRRLTGISIEDQFQRAGRAVLNQRTLRVIPLSNRYIPIVRRTVAQQIERLRSQIITAVLRRYGLCNGRSSRRRRGRSSRRSRRYRRGRR